MMWMACMLGGADTMRVLPLYANLIRIHIFDLFIKHSHRNMIHDYEWWTLWNFDDLITTASIFLKQKCWTRLKVSLESINANDGKFLKQHHLHLSHKQHILTGSIKSFQLKNRMSCQEIHQLLLSKVISPNSWN